ncbi:exported hypothetical protein [Acidobacteriia bacterium SbA2]|nr:exported hypothetical protein [Acidobacteriia bacterium SbA2]
MMKTAFFISPAILAMSVGIPLAGAAQDAASDQGPLIVEVQPNGTPKLSRLKPGDKLQGQVKNGVYSGERALIPPGSPIDLTVSSTERRRRAPSDRWPWVVRLFAPRRTRCPSALAATVHLRDGSNRPFSLTLVSATQQVELTAKTESRKSTASRLPGSTHKPSANPTLVLELRRPTDEEAMSGDFAPIPAPTRDGVTAGTVAHVRLLRDLRASKSRTGDTFMSRLAEPVSLSSGVVLPEGLLIRGKVVRSVAPRRLCRSGSLALSFTELMLPSGRKSMISASTSSVVVDRTSGLRMNSEGELKGARPGKASLLVDLGVSGGISKVTDDSFQLIAEALISTATDASTAGSARIVAAVFSGVYMLTRHGRDVTLPRYTNIEITFDRPAALASAAP